MAPSTPASTPKRASESHSSMSVSGNPICNGAACIGRDIQADQTDTGSAPAAQAVEPSTTTSSVGVAGKEQCRNGACIGLTDHSSSTLQDEGAEASNNG